MKRRNLLSSLFLTPLMFLFPKRANADPPLPTVGAADKWSIAWTSIKNNPKGTYLFQGEMPKTVKQVDELLLAHELSLHSTLKEIINKMSDDELGSAHRRDYAQSESLLVAGAISLEQQKRRVGMYAPGRFLPWAVVDEKKSNFCIEKENQ